MLEAGDARLRIAPDAGARIVSFVVRGREVLVTEGEGPIEYGCYPMVPFAGRIRHGRFKFRGGSHRLETNLGPHAIHGSVFDRPWEIVDEHSVAIDLGPGWPFRGRVVQRFDLTDRAFRATLELHADEPMPGMLGWHPWFRRRLGAPGGSAPAGHAQSGHAQSGHAPGGTSELPVVLDFHPGTMYERDPEGIPTSRLIAPGPHPWDDCFTGVHGDPRLTWPDRLELVVSSSCDHWVVYDEPTDAICVEPQSGPPNAANVAPVVVEPGAPLVGTMDWHWRVLED